MEEGGSSRIQTAAESGRPDPRRMASRPVDWMVAMMVEGGAVEVMVTRREGMEKVVEEMPGLFVSRFALANFGEGKNGEGKEREGRGWAGADRRVWIRRT